MRWGENAKRGNKGKKGRQAVAVVVGHSRHTDLDRQARHPLEKEKEENKKKKLKKKKKQDTETVWIRIVILTSDRRVKIGWRVQCVRPDQVPGRCGGCDVGEGGVKVKVFGYWVSRRVRG